MQPEQATLTGNGRTKRKSKAPFGTLLTHTTVVEWSTRECSDMVRTRQCFEISMKQAENTSYFNDQPQEEGNWWST